MGNLDGDNFTALNWYAQEPAEEDLLFKEVSDSYQAVMRGLSQIMDAHNIEKKANAGSSTQYLLLVSDEDRALLTIDQVLALYLIDVADRCKKSPPLVNYNANDKDATETTTAATISGKTQNTGRGSAQKATASLTANNDTS